MDKIANIKAEIERLKKYSNTMGSNAINSNMRNFYDGNVDALKQVEDFINSLPEEPVSKLWRDASEEPEFYKEFAIVSTDNVLTASYTLTNHGMSWNGIKEIDKVSKWCYVEDLIYKQEEPVSEELKEAANEAAEKAYPYIGGTKGMICESSKPIFIKGFKAGDKWQKEKMMSQAIDGFVICDKELTGGYKDIVFAMPKDLNVGDKVKLIIVRKD